MNHKYKIGDKVRVTQKNTLYDVGRILTVKGIAEGMPWRKGDGVHLLFEDSWLSITYVEPYTETKITYDISKLTEGFEVVHDDVYCPPSDPTNPEHYQGEACLDAIRASMCQTGYNGFLKGNVLKYLWRYENKGKPAEDLRKARWYLDKLISGVENEKD